MDSLVLISALPVGVKVIGGVLIFIPLIIFLVRCFGDPMTEDNGRVVWTYESPDRQGKVSANRRRALRKLNKSKK